MNFDQSSKCSNVFSSFVTGSEELESNQRELFGRVFLFLCSQVVFIVLRI